jgi:hypothetical protein
MGLSGSLRTMGLADLLQWLGHSQKTGTLLITGAEVEKSILMRDGLVIATSSNDPREYLGQFLVNYGYISEEELRKAMDVQREFNMLLGQILIMIDAISEDELQKLMRIKAEESLYDIFMWDEGDFNFIEGCLPDTKFIPLQIDVTRIIMEGLQRADEWSEIRRSVPSLDDVPTKVPDGTLPGRMDDLDKAVFDLVDGRRNVREIAFLMRSREFVVAKALHHLAAKGLVEVLPTAVPIEEKAGTELQIVDEGLIEIYRMLTRASMLLKKGEWEKAWETARSAHTLKPNDPQVLEKLEQVQSFILAELDRLGIQGGRVPELVKPLTELTGDAVTPREGFILSRVNGTWDIKAIVTVSPMHAVDSLLVFLRLWQKGLIRFRD